MADHSLNSEVFKKYCYNVLKGVKVWEKNNLNLIVNYSNLISILVFVLINAKKMKSSIQLKTALNLLHKSGG